MKVDSNQNKRRALKAELYRDNFQNSKVYNIPKAQLIVADIPYNVGNNAFEIGRASCRERV